MSNLIVMRTLDQIKVEQQKEVISLLYMTSKKTPAIGYGKPTLT